MILQRLVALMSSLREEEQIARYAAEDSHKGIGVAKITLAVNGANDPPVALSDPAVIDTFARNVPTGTLDIAKNLVDSVTVNYVFWDGQNWYCLSKVQ